MPITKILNPAVILIGRQYFKLIFYQKISFGVSHLWSFHVSTFLMIIINHRMIAIREI
jgi:hypothetical protein